MTAPKKSMFEGVIDSVAGASRMLYDWAGAEPTAEKKEPSILDLFPDGDDEPKLTDPVVRCARCKQPVVKGKCACEVIETEGEER